MRMNHAKNLQRFILPALALSDPAVPGMRRNAAVEADIQQLRAELLHKEQANGLVQLQLQEEKEERERAQRKVFTSATALAAAPTGCHAPMFIEFWLVAECI